eukprot:gene29979-37123_t
MQAAHDYAARIGFISNSHIVYLMYMAGDVPHFYDDPQTDFYLRKPGESLMGTILAPAVQAIGTRLLTALGAGAVAGVAGEGGRHIAQKRVDEADQAKSTPVARSAAQTKEKEKCKDCPIPKGAPFNRTFPERKPWVEYQARIGGLPSGPGFITEWIYNGVEFDGFDLGQCLLKEAKAG